MLIFYKSVDQSVLKEGFTIPVAFHDILLYGVGLHLQKGEKQVVTVEIDGTSYTAKLTNVQFNEVKFQRHGDILQIRYGTNTPIANRLRQEFVYTQQLIQKAEASSQSIRLKSLAENDVNGGVN